VIVDVNEQNRESCLCPGCPTFDECMAMEEESLFCGTSVTMCEDVSREGCRCAACDVHAAYGLSGDYYCLAGPAA